MNNQTEFILLPGFDHTGVEVSTKDLIRLNKGWQEMKKKEPRKYALCLESVKLPAVIGDTSLTEVDRLSDLGMEKRQILVIDGMVQRVVNHIENGEQLIKRAN